MASTLVVTTSKALVTTSVALVTSSDALVSSSFLLLLVMAFFSPEQSYHGHRPVPNETAFHEKHTQPLGRSLTSVVQKDHRSLGQRNPVTRALLLDY